MEGLKELKHKVESLIDVMHKLKAENEQLEKEKLALQKEHEDLKYECAVFAEENAQLAAQAKELKSATVDKDKNRSDLERERKAAKEAVDQILERLNATGCLPEQEQA